MTRTISAVKSFELELSSPVRAHACAYVCATTRALLPACPVIAPGTPLRLQGHMQSLCSSCMPCGRLALSKPELKTCLSLPMVTPGESYTGAEQGASLRHRTGSTWYHSLLQPASTRSCLYRGQHCDSYDSLVLRHHNGLSCCPGGVSATVPGSVFLVAGATNTAVLHGSCLTRALAALLLPVCWSGGTLTWCGWCTTNPCGTGWCS